MAAEIYEPAGFFLLRAPVLPLAQYHRLTASEGDGDLEARRRATRSTLYAAAGDTRVAQAVHIASPSTTIALHHLTPESRLDKQTVRTYSTLLRYLVRMMTRPTPYGLFAGAAMGEWDAGTDMRLGADPVRATRTRADSGWLLSLIKGLENADHARTTLATALNPLLYRNGDRAILPFADVHGEGDNRLIDFRITRPAEMAMAIAAEGGATLSDIIERIAAEVPGATPERATALVDQLWDLHVLISDLRPAPTAPIPELDLLKRLATGHHHEGLRTRLRQCRQLADSVDEDRGHSGVAKLEALTAHQRTMAPGYTGATYQVDSSLKLTRDRLGAAVGTVAAEAAELLLKVGVVQARPTHVIEYHHAFLERYGVDAEIPLLEVISPETGLDAPSTYTAPARPFPLTPVPDNGERRRDSILAAMLGSVRDGGAEHLELTDAHVERLAVWNGRLPAPRPALDLYAQVVATSSEAIDAGDWHLVVGANAMADGGRTFGRFFDLFDEQQIDHLRSYARVEEDRCPDVEFVELSYLPPYGRGGNVTAHPMLRRKEISVNTASSVPAEDRIGLADILVGATGERFYLRNRRNGRELRVTQGHMLSWASAPNMCRLLLELSDDGFAPLVPWDWGASGAAPWLPRVSRGRIVLSPARWLLSGDSIGVSGAQPLPDRNGFFAALQSWRRRWRVPRHVYLSYLDNRLLLDLDSPLFVDELHGELRRARRANLHAQVALQEALPGPEHAWLESEDGARHLSEIVVPLLVRGPVRRSGINEVPAAAATGSSRPRRRVVGEEWLHLKLYAALTRHDDMIAEAVPELVTELRAAGLADRWYFLRYIDPQPHLRLRLRAPSDETADALLAAAARGARNLVRSGLANDIVIASYDREIERYGGPRAIDHLEALFEANSEMVSGLVTARRAGLIDLAEDVVAVAALRSLRRQWTGETLPPAYAIGETGVPDATRRRFRDVQKVLCDLLEPWAHGEADMRGSHDTVNAIIEGQGAAVRAAAGRVTELAAARRLVGTSERILASVSHMQANRLLGLDSDAERRSHDLLALAAAAIRRRPRSL